MLKENQMSGTFKSNSGVENSAGMGKLFAFSRPIFILLL